MRKYRATLLAVALLGVALVAVIVSGSVRARSDEVTIEPPRSLADPSRASDPAVEDPTDEALDERRAASAATRDHDGGEASSRSSRSPTFTGRLLWQAGDPLRDAHAEATIHGSSNEHEIGFRTDGDGYFSFVYTGETASDPNRFLRITYRPARADRPLGVERRLFEPIAEDNHLGELRLEPIPLIVSGTVVGGSGEPIPGVWVRISRPIAAGFAGRSTRVARWDTSTGPAGGFRVLGWCADASVVIEASKSGGLSLDGAIEVSVGTADLVIVLEDRGTIEGHVVLDPGVDRQKIFLFSRQGDRGESKLRARPDDDDSFAMRLPPGVHDIEVGVFSSTSQYARVENVVVRSGQTTRDRRLDPLDLRGVVNLFRISVTDREGASLSKSIWVAYRPSTGDSLTPPDDAAWTTMLSPGGEVLIQTPWPRLDLSVTADGQVATLVSGVDSDRHVALDPALRVRILWEGVPEIPTNFDLRASLSAAHDGSYDWRQYEPIRGGSSTFLAKAPGAAELRLQLRRRIASSYWAKELFEEPHSIVVTGSNEEQVFEVEIPAERLEAARKELSER